MSRVKKARRYDSSGRIAQARRNRAAILYAAERQFLERGYSATTVFSIAREAGVSAETVYKSVGGKAELVGAIYERELAGRRQATVYERSDAMREHETNARKILGYWAGLIAELAPDLNPIRLLMRSAAEGDPDLAKVLEKSDKERLDRMRHNARFLARRGYLRAGVTAADAADVLWTCTSAEFYELLVQHRGWSLRRFERFVDDLLVAALLPSEPT